jgi:chloramphenicol-sensitive protein RarD
VSDQRRGVLLGVGAYLVWGLFPLYWPLLKPAGAVEILAHRIVWSLVFVVVLLVMRRRWTWVVPVLRDRRRLLILSVASVVIAVNWGIYIWAVNSDHVVEASLGYFINPLVTVLMGVLLLGERLRRGQWVAVGLAAVAVVLLTAAYGRLPWVALSLALSFATYGLMKKKVRMPAVESLGIECALLFLPALALILVMQARGSLAFGHTAWHVSLLLGCAGVVTAIPLLMFGSAAGRVPLTTMGLLQYLTPTLQFVIGILVFGEAMPLSRWVGFAFVWAALAVFSVDSLRAARTARRDRAAPDADDMARQPVPLT